MACFLFRGLAFRFGCLDDEAELQQIGELAAHGIDLRSNASGNLSHENRFIRLTEEQAQKLDAGARTKKVFKHSLTPILPKGGWLDKRRLLAGFAGRFR